MHILLVAERVEAARHLLWRDFHRVHQELEEKGPEASSDEDLKMMKDQIKEMSKQIAAFSLRGLFS